MGHTGGTLDKLESIPGFKVQLAQGDFIRQLERIGVAVVGQSERLVPADRILYALRDVTATIDDEGLIAASIMAKKVASGTSGIVLDIKVGGGAFMADLEKARSLGRLCRVVGEAFDRRVTCVYTAMDQPLGWAVGNRVEVEEAWQVLKGQGPEDVRTLVVTLAGAVLALSDLGISEAEGSARAAHALDDGSAAEWFDRWVTVQGGSWKPGEFHRLAAAELVAERDGYVTGVEARLVGRAAQLSGAGRQRADDEIDAAAGVVLRKKTGDAVEAGERLAVVYARRRELRELSLGVMKSAFTIAAEAPAPPTIVLARD
jgi:pyrimidine-nucleoside phosphorylase